jgi:hypothetical protein
LQVRGQNREVIQELVPMPIEGLQTLSPAKGSRPVDWLHRVRVLPQVLKQNKKEANAAVPKMVKIVLQL